MKTLRLKVLLISTFITSCSKMPLQPQILYYELEGTELEFPTDYSSANTLLIDADMDGISEFEISTYFEPIYDINNTDSVIDYQRAASLITLNDYQVPIVFCHIDGGSTVSLHEGDKINNSIIDIFPSDYDKCSCIWGNSCYIYKTYEEGYTRSPRYIAIRLKKDDEEYFGWLNIQTDDKFTAKSFAISQIAHKEILVGQIE